MKDSKAQAAQRDNNLLFRQTRFVNEASLLEMNINGAKTELVTWSRTGVGFEGKADLYKIGDQIKDVSINCRGTTLFTGNMVVRNARPLANGKWHYGASFSSSLFIVEGVESAAAVDECMNRIGGIMRHLAEVNAEFCRSVTTLRLCLREVKRTCDTEQARWEEMTFDQRIEAERIFIPSIALRLKEICVGFNHDISTQVDVEKIPDDSDYHRIFHELIYPFFEDSDVVKRAHDKPRGYAGDFEMMNQIYRNGFEGKTLFGKALHHYITNENSAESVKFRRPLFVTHYQDILKAPGNKSCLSIACGPAVEVQDVVRLMPQADLDRLSITLFDLDRQALEHAQTKIYQIAIEERKELKIQCINASVKSFLTAASDQKVTFDFIYSGGLFDYLDQLTATALTNRFARMLNPGGRLIIGNFTKDNKTKAFLHLLTKWTLIHRTEDEVREWAADLSDCSVDVTYDHGRMNAFLVLKKNG